MRAVLGVVAVAAATLMTDGARAQDDAALVQRGAYLAKAADCMPCHTGPSGAPFAGGLALNTPFGAIYSPNITSDRKTGIGDWTFSDFDGAVRNGIGKGHKFLYPAMPFDSYTQITDDDIKALWAYVRTIPAVERPNDPNALPFPFNIRYSLIGWRELFFENGRFKPNPAKDAEWNRGAYLVDALGHCGDCHTPRNVLGATESSQALAGAPIDNWYAPDLTTDTLKSLDGWTKPTLAAYLKNGSAKQTTVFGPMYEVVHDSLAYLTDQDLTALAAYLLDQPRTYKTRPPQAASKMTAGAHDRGAKLYVDNCIACHQDKGAGMAGAIPPLAGNPAVLAAGPGDVIRVVLQGIAATGKFGAMPGFAGALSDRDVADVANYVRTSWGNTAAPNATPEMASGFRAAVAVAPAGTDAARALDCPQVGGGPSATDLDPATIKLLNEQMSGGAALNIPKLIATYQNANQGAGLADTVNALVGAYCPILAKGPQDNAAKRAALGRFANDVAAYVAGQATPAPGPQLGIVWATAAGNSLVAHLPDGTVPFACPADDGKLVAQPLVAAATPLVATVGPRVPAPAIADLTAAMWSGQAKARPADIADALILAYCKAIDANAGLVAAQKGAVVTRFGEQVIEDLQNSIEAARAKTAAK
ncbi:MAG: c-type cytochrome [Ferrovibrionaceae bacterium]